MSCTGSSSEMTRDEQILSVDNLCKNLARRYQGRADFDDLYQEARIGVCDCVDRFDESKGVKFSTYAFYAARSSIMDYFNNSHRMITKPRYATEHKQIINIENLENVGVNDTYNEIDLSFLKPIEQFVIQRYFIDGYTLEELTNEAGFSNMFWSRLKNTALAKLKLKLSN